MESEINTGINSLEISDEIKLGIEEIPNHFSLDKSLDDNLSYILDKIYELEEISKGYSLKIY